MHYLVIFRTKKVKLVFMISSKGQLIIKMHGEHSDMELVQILREEIDGNE